MDNLSAGTLLLSTAVSGDDTNYVEQKAANPNVLELPQHHRDERLAGRQRRRHRSTQHAPTP